MNLVVDTETGRFQDRNNAYSKNGMLVSVHTYSPGNSPVSIRVKHSSGTDPPEPYLNVLKKAKKLILFNGKFDLSHLRKNNLLPEQLPIIWDVQLAHFLLSRQQNRMPSLNSVLEHYQLPLKIDVVKTEYWDKGIETREVPWDVLKPYGEYDCQGTYLCYEKQIEEFKQKPQLYRLFQILCRDLLVLFEMEWNGLKYNSEKCKEQSEKLQIQIDSIGKQLGSIYPDVPINFNSSQQLSAYLYGGNIKEEKRHLVGYYKTGAKTGQPRFRVEEVVHVLPRLVEPLKGSEMAAEGVFSTDEGTLRKLKGGKHVVEPLLKLAKLSKLNETYFQGMNKLNNEMNWPKDMLHGTYNQCVAQTGRLSSSTPNSQNFSDDFLLMMESRYV